MKCTHIARGLRALWFQVVLDQGGLAPGGLNFDCKVRRESTRVKDMFIAHIGTNHTVILHKFFF